MNLSPLTNAFSSEEHQAFHLPGGSPAALLVHGFPGTPAEMLPLGQVIHRVGWTVKGLLLPGFGPQIESLFEKKYSDWVDSIRQSLNELKRQHHPILLAGFSMGAALSLQAAVEEPPNGLLLLAPYWKLAGLVEWILPIMRYFSPTFRPYKLVKLDLSDPDARKGMTRLLPGVNLDDPQVQQGLRDFSVPVSFLGEINRAGRAAWQAAPRLYTPTLVIQGNRDKVVTATMTRKLIRRIPGNVAYTEIPAGHDLPDPEGAGWPQLEAAVIRFATEILRTA